MSETCEWKQNQDGVWETECMNIFEITEGDPHENALWFCPYCGKHLYQIDEVKK